MRLIAVYQKHVKTRHRNAIKNAIENAIIIAIRGVVRRERQIWRKSVGG